jgi:hypothetical protein
MECKEYQQSGQGTVYNCGKPKNGEDSRIFLCDSCKDAMIYKLVKSSKKIFSLSKTECHYILCYIKEKEHESRKQINKYQQEINKLLQCYHK